MGDEFQLGATNWASEWTYATGDTAKLDKYWEIQKGTPIQIRSVYPSDSTYQILNQGLVGDLLETARRAISGLSLRELTLLERDLASQKLNLLALEAEQREQLAD